MSRLTDLAGKTFFHVLVLSRAPDRGNHSYWNCRCLKCGREWEVCGQYIGIEGIQQCKTCSNQQRKIHGLKGSPLYLLWHGINNRCYNPRQTNYANYGGRGIANYWKKDLVGFVAYLTTELGPKPDGHTLDRIDNEKGYEPGNLRWATAREQNINKRKSPLNTSGVTGVSRVPGSNKWRVRVSPSIRRQKHFGHFDSFEEAVQARKIAEAEYYG